MKKKYVSPELELLILEQTDIITSSPVGSDTNKPGSEIGPGTGKEDVWGDDWD